jgi:hypothetical protein
MARNQYPFFTGEDILASTEIAVIDDVTAGTGLASKAMVLSSGGKWTYGTTSTPISSTTAGSEFFAWRTACSATSGSSYAARFQHKITGAAGSGAAIRGYSFAYGVSATYMYGGEFTAEVHASSSSDIASAGTMAGVRGVATLALDTTGYTYAGLFNFDVATGKTASATKSAFIHCQNLGLGTGTTALFSITTTVANDTPTALVSTHANHATDTLVRILINDTAYWLCAVSEHA